LANPGGYGYAKVPMAFLGMRNDNLATVEQVSRAPIMCITAVSKLAIKTGSRPVIGVDPLEQELLKEVKFFRINSDGNGLLIYVSIPQPPNADRQYEAEATDCVGLEPLFA
jgi:hypothetical protein